MMNDPFGIYLIKSASEKDPIKALANAAQAGSPEIDVKVKAVQEASATSGAPISKSKAALLVALGIGVGAGGTLLYQHMNR